MNAMNEALLKRPLDGKEEVDVVATVPLAYADAVEQHIKTEKKMEDDFKEPKKNVEDFLKVNHDKDQKPKGTPELKKMKLTEATDFGDPMEFGRGPCVPLVYDMTSDITQLVKMLSEGDEYRDYGITTLKRLVPRLMDNKQSIENFNEYWAARYSAAIDYIDKQIALIPEDVLNEILGIKTEDINSTVDVDIPDDDDVEGIKEFLDFNVPVTASVQANGNNVPFLNGTSKTEDVDPDFFQLDADDTLTESPVAVAEPETKKRVRSPNEEKDPWDYSSEDVWYAVYDELSASVDNEGKGQQVDKQIKAKRGERYEHVYPHGEKDIIVYAKDPEEFEFAKKVAKHYGVTCEEPKRDENRNSNGFYKYSMVINMPDLF